MSLLVAGLLAAVVGMLGGWLVYQMSSDRVAVVAVARPVAFGQQVSLDDLRQALIPPGTELSTVAWTDVSEVVGRLAGAELLVGQLLPREVVRAELIPEPGEAVIGMPVGPGQLPATPLHPQDEVLVIRADDAGSTVRATVLQVGPVTSAGARTVDLLVPEGQVPSLARAASEEQTVLVLVGRR